MNFTVDASIPMLTVFFQGLLSFFSPCVLPLVPLYISYFSGGAKKVDPDGTVHYPRGRILLHTVCFVLGISATFFLLGIGFTSLGKFFSANQTLFARISGVIMILFGLYQLDIFGRSAKLDQERRLPFRLDRLAMSPFTAFLMGFFFSFAWTPCVGPVLGSVLLMAGSASTAAKGFFLIAVYTLGFVLPFLAVGLFTGAVLDFFKKHTGVVRYTVKIGAVLMLFMGVMTLSGFMNGLTGYLSNFDSFGTRTAETAPSGGQNDSLADEALPADGGSKDSQAGETPTSADGQSSLPADGSSASSTETMSDAAASDNSSEAADASAAPDFTLKDQNGVEHTLSAYQGKTVFLNFWATWCPPCRSEMPEIQALYEKYGENEGDLIVLGIASPNAGNEGSAADITAFLTENGYTFPVVMDYNGLFSSLYGIRAYPTTFMISKDGSVFGYAQGALTGEMMESIVEQTMEGVRK